MLFLVTSASIAPAALSAFRGVGLPCDGFKLTGAAERLEPATTRWLAGYRPWPGAGTRAGNSPYRLHAVHTRPSRLGFVLRGLSWPAGQPGLARCDPQQGPITFCPCSARCASTR